jgi:hypothetical protein
VLGDVNQWITVRLGESTQSTGSGESARAAPLQRRQPALERRGSVLRSRSTSGSSPKNASILARGVVAVALSAQVNDVAAGRRREPGLRPARAPAVTPAFDVDRGAPRTLVTITDPADRDRALGDAEAASSGRPRRNRSAATRWTVPLRWLAAHGRRSRPHGRGSAAEARARERRALAAPPQAAARCSAAPYAPRSSGGGPHGDATVQTALRADPPDSSGAR